MIELHLDNNYFDKESALKTFSTTGPYLLLAGQLFTLGFDLILLLDPCAPAKCFSSQQSPSSSAKISFKKYLALQHRSASYCWIVQCLCSFYLYSINIHCFHMILVSTQAKSMTLCSHLSKSVHIGRFSAAFVIFQYIFR